MWCAQCQADVATELSADGQAQLCTSCGAEVRQVHVPSLHPQIRSARELLDRWSQDDDGAEAPAAPRMDGVDADTQEPMPMADAAGPSASEHGPDVRTRPTIRIDAAHPVGGARREPSPRAGRTGAIDERRLPPHARKDAGHATIPAPHFDVTAPVTDARHPGRTEAAWGQLLAYAGVGVLTVGTALVLWGYFGGPADYAPTGWLVATAGQMLLFLGVVTLVSGGMQQTAHEVSARVQLLGNRMVRIEETTQQLLQGPHFGRAAEVDSETAAVAGDASDAV
jgi:hypothetical protein